VERFAFILRNSSDYAFCFSSQPSPPLVGPAAGSSILPFFPQSAGLRRLTRGFSPDRYSANLVLSRSTFSNLPVRCFYQTRMPDNLAQSAVLMGVFSLGVSGS